MLLCYSFFAAVNIKAVISKQKKALKRNPTGVMAACFKAFKNPVRLIPGSISYYKSNLYFMLLKECLHQKNNTGKITCIYCFNDFNNTHYHKLVIFKIESPM
jgi:hypothetical protein